MSALSAALRIWLGRMRRNHVHLTVRGRDGDGAFGVLGSPHVAAHFSRIYCGDREYASTCGVHGDGGVRFATESTRRHGLTVISEAPVPAALEAESLRVPIWVAMNASVAGFPDEYVKSLPRSARSDVSKIRQRDFTHEVCRDPAWACEFFERYHKPSIVDRHGEEGFVMDGKMIEHIVATGQGELLKLMRGSACDAAMLAHHDGDGYRMARLGWCDGDPALVKEGVLAALYWHAFIRAQELGCAEVRFGGTPAYLEDGLFRVKTKWGAQLSREHCTYGERHLHVDPSHPDCRRMFMERSFIAFGPGDSFVVFSGRTPEEVKAPESVTSQLAAWYQLRETPAPWRGCEDAAVPIGLRPWFEKVWARPANQVSRPAASASL